jgi:hypothetical protein
MIPAILFMVSLAAFIQFGLYYWRATISGVAAQPLSERIRHAACISSPTAGANDFHNILKLKDLSPDLQGSTGSFAVLRSYYAIVERVGSLIPAMANWSNSEMTTCARYVAVLMDRHMERNMACAAELRGI